MTWSRCLSAAKGEPLGFNLLAERADKLKQSSSSVKRRSVVRKFKSIFLSVLALGVFSLHTHGGAETIRNTVQGNRQGSSSSDALAPFLGNPGRSGSSTAAPSVLDPLEPVSPAGFSRQEASAESKLGWALWEMTQKTGDAAKAVKETVKTSITDYVKDKQRQSRQQDLVEKFYTNLQYVSANLQLAPRDQQELTGRVQRVYIDDAESGRYELDSLHFGELPYIVRKEYADMVLERTKNGEADTYHLNGALKTRWTLKKGQPDGPIVTYYENGEINFIDVFKAGRKVRRTKYDAEGKIVFEQNYEYGLTDETEFAEKERAVPERQKPMSSPVDEDSKVSPLSRSKNKDASGFVELPPQVSADLIEV